MAGVDQLDHLAADLNKLLALLTHLEQQRLAFRVVYQGIQLGQAGGDNTGALGAGTFERLHQVRAVFFHQHIQFTRHRIQPRGDLIGQADLTRIQPHHAVDGAAVLVQPVYSKPGQAEQ